MGVGGGIGPANGKAYPGKLTLKVAIICIVAASGGLIFGYDIGISGGVTSMPKFLEEFFPDVYRKEKNAVETDQYCKFNSQILTMFTSSLYLAALVASWFAATLTRLFGRKVSMIIGGCTFLVGAAINAAAQNVAMLIIGRMFLGVGIGFANQAVPVFLSEMAPYKHRGALNMMFQLSITIGILIANVLNYFTAKIHDSSRGWRISLGCAAIPGALFIIGSFFLTDTPNSLLERGKEKEAKERLREIRGVDNVNEEFNDMVIASEESKKIKHPWRNILNKKYRPQLTLSILIPFFQQFTGMNVIMFYAPVLFKTIGFGDSASLMSAVITGLVNMLATLVSIFVVDKFGRKGLFIEGGLQMLVSQIIIAIFIASKFGVNGNPGELPMWYAIIVVLFICIYVAGFAWSWGPLGWLVPSEIFPLEVRSAGQSINVSVNMIFTFVIAQIFTSLLCHLKFGLFLFFAFFVLIMTIFICIFFPETKGIPIDEMSVIWSQHWFWKKYVPPPPTIYNRRPLGGDIEM